ncbi:MAG TPA: acyl carrier protein [Mycobacteriales bacterium]|nr:acyl carrier protein [Mycobacteriales bacterium]
MPPDQIVTEIVAQLLDVDETALPPEQVLADIDGWDSVNSLRVLVYLEREVGSALDYDRFAAAETVGELTELVGGSLAGSDVPS